MTSSTELQEIDHVRELLLEKEADHRRGLRFCARALAALDEHVGDVQPTARKRRHLRAVVWIPIVGGAAFVLKAIKAQPAIAAAGGVAAAGAGTVAMTLAICSCPPTEASEAPRPAIVGPSAPPRVPPVRPTPGPSDRAEPPAPSPVLKPTPPPTPEPTLAPLPTVPIAAPIEIPKPPKTKLPTPPPTDTETETPPGGRCGVRVMHLGLLCPKG